VHYRPIKNPFSVGRFIKEVGYFLIISLKYISDEVFIVRVSLLSESYHYSLNLIICLY